MKFAVRAIITALSLIATASMSHAGGPYGSISVGNWRGGAYTYDKDGSFSHCAAGATYQSGIYFMVSVNADLSWTLGFSHPVTLALPKGVTAQVPAESKGTQLILTGNDKELMGQLAAKIRDIRPPEPYGGKGVRYKGEKVRQKAGKSGGKGK